jgi:hypothetical protein
MLNMKTTTSMAGRRAAAPARNVAVKAGEMEMGVALLFDLPAAPAACQGRVVCHLRRCDGARRGASARRVAVR